MKKYDELERNARADWQDELIREANTHMSDLKSEFALSFESADVNDLDEYKTSTDGNVFGLSEDDLLDIVNDVNQYKQL